VESTRECKSTALLYDKQLLGVPHHQQVGGSKEVWGQLKSSFPGQVLNFRTGLLLRRETSWKYDIQGLFQPGFAKRICFLLQ
jgi:hypothetical protein